MPTTNHADCSRNTGAIPKTLECLETT